VDIGPSPDGAFAEVTVRDSGIGIPDDEIPHLFERFRRVENARGRSIEGSGIGLALAQQIARAHSGEIRLANREDGSGARATIRLPIANSPVTADSAAIEG